MENAPFEYSKSESAFLLLLRQSFRFAARMLTLYFTTRRRCLQARGIKIGQILLFCEEKKQILFCAFEKKRLLPQKGLCNALYLRYLFFQFKLQKRQKINKLLQKNIAIFGSMWYRLNGYQPDFIILFGNYKIPIKSK